MLPAAVATPLDPMAPPPCAAGINMEIPTGPAAQKASRAPPPAADPVQEKEKAVAAAPLKPAFWAAAEKGLNQKKAMALADKAHLEDCPICMEWKADIQMKPCGHEVCGGCLDQWMSQRSSFAQTLRNGCSDTTCPLCRTAVEETLPVGRPIDGQGVEVSGGGTVLPPPGSRQASDKMVWPPPAPRQQASGGGTVLPPPVPRPGKAAEQVCGTCAAGPWSSAGAPASAGGGTSVWAGSMPSLFEPPKEAQPLGSLGGGAPHEERSSVTSDTIEARLAAVMQDEPEPELGGHGGTEADDGVDWRREEALREKEQEEARAHAAWMKAQMSGSTQSPTASQAASDASTAVAVGAVGAPQSSRVASQSPPPEEGLAANGAARTKPSDLWSTFAGGVAFGLEPGGSATPFAMAGAVAASPIDRKVERQLRTELGAL